MEKGDLKRHQNPLWFLKKNLKSNRNKKAEEIFFGLFYNKLN